jgi:hypothetical protein
MKYDGLLPNVMGEDGAVRMGPPSHNELRAIKVLIEDHRTQTTPFDIVMEGETPGNDPEKAASIVCGWEDAGATWWIEAMWAAPGLEDVLARIKQGPPRIEGR